MRLLEKKPEDRYADLREMCEELCGGLEAPRGVATWDVPLGQPDAPECRTTEIDKTVLAEHGIDLPALATRQIDVFRHARPAKAYQQEAQELRAENAQLRSRVKQLESQELTRGGLADLLYHELIGEQGVRVSRLVDLEGRHGGALSVHEGWSVHAPARGRVALKLTVTQPQPREWSIKEIFLKDEHGGVFVPITWIGKDPIPPANQRHFFVLEWELKGTAATRPFALVVVGDDGRIVRVNRIMFPQ
jgi:uncharacterized protein (TIGR02268 family)